MKRVFIDMDNVLVDFQSGLDQVNEEIKAEYAGRQDEIPDLFGKMKPMAGAIEAVHELQKHHDLFILSTAPWKNPTAWSDKVFEEHISGAKKNEERPVLCEAIAYCKEHRISTLLVSELSRMGRNAFEVLASVKELLDCGINLYIQKEQFNLLGEDGKPSLFVPIMLATLSTCAQLERDNITFRLQSGRKQYIAKGGKLGRKPGSVKSDYQKREEYKEAISLLRKGYAIRDVAKLTGKGISTIQRVKKEFC